MRRLALLVLTVTLGCPAAARAQLTAAAATAVADSFFRFRAERRWHDAARLLDTASIAATRAQLLRFARRAQPARTELTPELLMQHDPAMPRAVAEYQARKANEHRMENPWNPLEYAFAHVATADSLAVLPLAEAGARWVEAHDVRWTMRRQMAQMSRSGCDSTAVREQMTFVDSLAARPSRALGAVLESATAYVLYREHLDSQPPGQTRSASDTSGTGRRRARRAGAVGLPPGVLTLRELAGRWRIHPDGMNGGSTSFAFSCAAGLVPASSNRRPER